jgi:hypothetical protein
MNTFSTLFAALLAVVMVTLVTNLVQLYKETKQLKAAGKTPLHGRNSVVIMTAALAEVLVIYLTLRFCSFIQPEEMSMAGVFTVFVLTYLLRNVGAYLAAWGLWSIFIRIDKKKLLKQIAQEKAEAL